MCSLRRLKWGLEPSFVCNFRKALHNVCNGLKKNQKGSHWSDCGVSVTFLDSCHFVWVGCNSLANDFVSQELDLLLDQLKLFQAEL